MQANSVLIKLEIALGLLLAAGGASTAHASVDVQCTVPALVECVVTEPLGIRKITVRAETDASTIVLVDNSYSCVSAATVSFDGTLPSSQLEVTTCSVDAVPPRPATGYAEPGST